MSSSHLKETMFDALRRERERTEYPEDMPALPPMPAARYFDPVFYELEIEHVFKKTWLAAGHISELPQPGSYKLFEQFGQSIIISRGDDDVIRGFKNTCRHRGAALVNKPSGTARRFVCPYHSWGYASNGALKSVPEAQNFSCLDKTSLPLLQVKCESWRGIIFINFDDNAESLEKFFAPIAERVTDFPFEKLTFKGLVVNKIDCNWKTAYDNFVESYHINTVHSKTIAPYMDIKSFTVERLANGHGCLRSFKKGGESIFGDKKIADVAESYKAVTLAIPHFPNGTAGLDPAGFSWQSLFPAGPEKCVMVNLYLGQTLDAPDADRKYWDDFMAYNDVILAEDMFLFTTIQRSMREGDLSELRLSTQEQYIQWYNEYIDLKIGIENIPPQLRVAQVLSPLGNASA